MKTLKKFTFFFYFIVLILTSCSFFRLSPGQKTASIKSQLKQNFSHVNHSEAFLKLNVRCVNCHQFISFANVPVDKKEAISEEIDAMKTKACHFCHKEGEGKYGFRKDCGFCHSQVKEILPDFHRGNFLKRHGYLAKVSDRTCSSCHRENFCIKCHSDRDKIRADVHDRNYRFYHSVEARANPRKCDSCHITNYCIKCHQNEALKP